MSIKALLPSQDLWDTVMAYSLLFMEIVNKERQGDEGPIDVIERLRKTRWPPLPKAADVAVNLSVAVCTTLIDMYPSVDECFEQMKIAAAKVLVQGRENQKKAADAAKRARFDEIRARRNGNGKEEK